MKVVSLDECLSVLSNGYIKGFLKVGGPELLKGGGGASREVRIGVAQVSGHGRWVWLVLLLQLLGICVLPH